VNRIARGEAIPLDATYRDSAGTLVDPVGPLVSIRRPDGSVAVAPTPPVRLSTGVYRYPGAGSYAVPLDAPLGLWVARWTGTVEAVPLTGDEAFEVAAVTGVGGHYGYGATVGDVEALLPHRSFTAATPTTPADLTAWALDLGARVGARVEAGLVRLRSAGGADPTLALRVADLDRLARVAVALGVAATAEDAGYPERAGVDATDSSYGAVLWDRHRSAVEDLAARVAAEVEVLDRLARAAGAGIAGSFPLDNMAARGMRW